MILFFWPHLSVPCTASCFKKLLFAYSPDPGKAQTRSENNVVTVCLCLFTIHIFGCGQLLHILAFVQVFNVQFWHRRQMARSAQVSLDTPSNASSSVKQDIIYRASRVPALSVRCSAKQTPLGTIQHQHVPVSKNPNLRHSRLSA